MEEQSERMSVFQVIGQANGIRMQKGMEKKQQTTKKMKEAYVKT